MPNRHSSADQSRTPGSPPLLERVRARVLSANHALQRRDSAPPSGRQAPQLTAESAEKPSSVPLSIEHRALLVVYHTLGRTHRRHRERTGEHVPPGLKDAARAFKREPSVSSLVPVAGFLDDLGLLKW